MKNKWVPEKHQTPAKCSFLCLFNLPEGSVVLVFHPFYIIVSTRNFFFLLRHLMSEKQQPHDKLLHLCTTPSRCAIPRGVKANSVAYDGLARER